MALDLRFLDGFDHYTSLLLKWSFGTGTVSPTGGRFGGGRLTNIGTPLIRPTKVFENQPSYAVGWAVKFTGAGGPTNVTILTLMDGATVQVQLQYTNAGVVQLLRGATIIAIGTTVLEAQQWYYLEFGVTIHPPTGNFVLRINGTTEFSGSSANTRNTASN